MIHPSNNYWNNEMDEDADEIKRLNEHCKVLVGEECLHQEGKYETEMVRLRKERDEAREAASDFLDAMCKGDAPPEFYYDRYPWLKRGEEEL